MLCSRMYIKSYKDESGRKIVKIDFSSIKVITEKKNTNINVYKSTVSEERITLQSKKNKLFFHLTKNEPNGIIFVYEEIFTKDDLENNEKVFILGIEKHFKFWFSFFFKKEMTKILSVKKVYCQGV